MKTGTGYQQPGSDRRFIRRRMRSGVLSLLAALLISGCALTRSQPMPVFRPAVNTNGWADHQWWHVRYRFSWPEDTDPAWHLDLLLAHRVAAPVIAEYGDRIPLWRFHRRAARDAVGHQFSFIFYADPQTAVSVISALRHHPVIDGLQSSGRIREIVDDADQRHDTQPVEATSDARWSAPVRKSWPYYIMGVSRMWLGLIDAVVSAGQPPPAETDMAAVDEYYRKVGDTIRHTWQEEGRHALLHHLNALFGYEPLVVYEKRFLRF